MPTAKRPRMLSDASSAVHVRSILLSQIFRHCPNPPVERVETDEDRDAFVKWWREEVTGRQQAFSPAYELSRLQLTPPFHTSWSDIKTRRDRAVSILSAVGASASSQLCEAMKSFDSRAVGREGFELLASWYGEHFPPATAFLPRILDLDNWPSVDPDPPGPREIQELAAQWAAHFGRGIADPAHKCDSALGLIGMGDRTMVYGMDLRDQLVITVTYDSPSDETLNRVFGPAIELIEPNENRRVYWKTKAVPLGLGSEDTSLMLGLAFLRVCADRGRRDDGRNLLPRHQEDLRTLQRTPFLLTEGGEWDPVDKGLWQLQFAYDLVGIAEAYVEVAEHLVPGLLSVEGDD